MAITTLYSLLTRFEIAELKSTRNMFSTAERSRPWMPVVREIYVLLYQNVVMQSSSPSKSNATISASSVGETDIQTPSKYAQCC